MTGTETHSAELEGTDLENRIDWDSLPQGLRELRNILGAEGAVLLARSFGGRNLYIPHQPRPGSLAFPILGPELLGRLSQTFGGMSINVPKPDAVFRQLTPQAIRQEREEGATAASLAARYGLTRRRILQIVAAARGAESVERLTGKTE